MTRVGWVRDKFPITEAEVRTLLKISYFRRGTKKEMSGIWGWRLVVGAASTSPQLPASNPQSLALLFCVRPIFLRPRGRRDQEAISFSGPLGILEMKVLELESRRELEGARSPEAKPLTDSCSRLAKGLIENRVIIGQIRDVEQIEDLSDQLQ
jgi:hypothetical protein